MPHARRTHPLRDHRERAVPPGRRLTRWSAVLLDRDGTINLKAPEGEYVTTPDALVLLPGAGEAVARLNAAGLPVHVVTNQRGIARAVMTLQDLAVVHERLTELLAEHGAHVDGVYFCPHPGGTCDCRKPLPGLVRQVLAEHPTLDRAALALVGDAESDVAAGLAAGAWTVRLAAPGTATAAHATVPDLASAVDLLLA